MSNRVFPPSVLLSAQSLAASFNGSPIHTQGLRKLSLTLAWTAVASTDGAFSIQTSDDPRVLDDIKRGTSTATWVPRTIPASSYDGTNITPSDGSATASVTIDANAGTLNLILENAGAFLRLVYTRTAGGGAGQLRVCMSATD